MAKYGDTKQSALAALDRKIRPGEPFFVLRAQDMLAPFAVSRYADLLVEHDLYDQASDVRAFIRSMRTWQNENPTLTKMPD